MRSHNPVCVCVCVHDSDVCTDVCPCGYVRASESIVSYLRRISVQYGERYSALCPFHALSGNDTGDVALALAVALEEEGKDFGLDSLPELDDTRSGEDPGWITVCDQLCKLS